jgi:hypothetical protein
MFSIATFVSLNRLFNIFFDTSLCYIAILFARNNLQYSKFLVAIGIGSAFIIPQFQIEFLEGGQPITDW